MGLVQNLKKKLNDWAEKILVELSYHYIKQRAKQTLRRPDNYLLTEFSPNPLTAEDQRSIIATSSTDTSEKITMVETEDIVAHVRGWSLDRAADMTVDKGDARAILAEFYEWIEPESSELEIVSLDEINEDEYNDYLERS
jgi:hypothetical protein